MMSTSSDSQDPYPGAFAGQDRAYEENLKLLQKQEQLLTRDLGGTLPEQPNPAAFRRVLDVGCGAGGWLLELARTYPSTIQLVGMDINNVMIKYAIEQAEAQHLSDRVQFIVQDALTGYNFPQNTFDLVNVRMGLTFIRRWNWQDLMDRFLYVTRPGGVIRFTESKIPTSTSAAFNTLSYLLLEALDQAGHLFSREGASVTGALPSILTQAGLQDVQARPVTIDYYAGTPKGQVFSENTKQLFIAMQPFLRKWTRMPDDYETVYQQMLLDLQTPGIKSEWPFVTVWGTTPE